MSIILFYFIFYARFALRDSPLFCKEATHFGFYSSVSLFYVSVCPRFTYIAYTNCSVKASSSLNRVHNPLNLNFLFSELCRVCHPTSNHLV